MTFFSFDGFFEVEMTDKIEKSLKEDEEERERERPLLLEIESEACEEGRIGLDWIGFF